MSRTFWSGDRHADDLCLWMLSLRQDIQLVTVSLATSWMIVAHLHLTLFQHQRLIFLESGVSTLHQLPASCPQFAGYNIDLYCQDSYMAIEWSILDSLQAE